MLLEGKNAVISGGGGSATLLFFVASDQARSMTAATVNIGCGGLVD